MSVTLQFPRDWDILQSLHTRQSPTITDPAATSTIANAAVPIPTCQQYNARGHQLHYFLNGSEAEGCSILTPSGHCSLPQRLMIDSGSVTAIMDKDYAMSIGVTWKPHPSLKIRTVEGRTSPILGITHVCQLVFAKGTTHERRVHTQFLILEGVAAVYQVLIGQPQTDPDAGFVDPLPHQYYYRPRWQTHADDTTIHSLPLLPHALAALPTDSATTSQVQIITACSTIPQPSSPSPTPITARGMLSLTLWLGFIHTICRPMTQLFNQAWTSWFPPSPPSTPVHLPYPILRILGKACKGNRRKHHHRHTLRRLHHQQATHAWHHHRKRQYVLLCTLLIACWFTIGSCTIFSPKTSHHLRMLLGPWQTVAALTTPLSSLCFRP